MDSVTPLFGIYMQEVAAKKGLCPGHRAGQPGVGLGMFIALVLIVCLAMPPRVVVVVIV